MGEESSWCDFFEVSIFDFLEDDRGGRESVGLVDSERVEGMHRRPQIRNTTILEIGKIGQATLYSS